MPAIRPSLAVRVPAIGFLFGIAFASFAYVEGRLSPALLLLSCIVTLGCALFLFRHHARADQLALTLMAVVGLLAGVFAYAGALPGPNSILHVVPRSVRLTGLVVDAHLAESSQSLTLAHLQVDDVSVEDRAIIHVPRVPTFSYGDVVTVRCDLAAPEPFDGFAYDRYLAARDVYATCFVSSPPTLVATGQGRSTVAHLLTLRSSILAQMNTVFGEPHASLLAGLLFGEQRFSDAWNERFVATGTSHVVAASGYNVALVTFVLSALMFAVGVRRQQALALLLVGIAAYVVLAGAQPPVVRAAIMGALVLVRAQLGRKTSMANILLLCGALMLLANPRLLRDDVGFQLSMLSTVALVYVAPVLQKRLRFLPERYAVRESMSATLAATLVTLPVVFVSFGQVSLVAPIANVLILPLVPFAMAFGAFAAAGSFLVGSGSGAVMAGPAWALLSTILWMVRALAQTPAAAVVLPSAWRVPLAIAAAFGILALWKVAFDKSFARRRSSLS